MANTIRLKRASGSDPGASDLVTFLENESVSSFNIDGGSY